MSDQRARARMLTSAEWSAALAFTLAWYALIFVGTPRTSATNYERAYARARGEARALAYMDGALWTLARALALVAGFVYWRADAGTSAFTVTFAVYWLAALAARWWHHALTASHRPLFAIVGAAAALLGVLIVVGALLVARASAFVVGALLGYALYLGVVLALTVRFARAVPVALRAHIDESASRVRATRPTARPASLAAAMRVR